MTESEWKRVEKYIDEHDDIYDDIRRDMWYDVRDWLARNYNRRGYTVFKCDSIEFDGDNAVWRCPQTLKKWGVKRQPTEFRSKIKNLWATQTQE